MTRLYCHCVNNFIFNIINVFFSNIFFLLFFVVNFFVNFFGAFNPERVLQHFFSPILFYISIYLATFSSFYISNYI